MDSDLFPETIAHIQFAREWAMPSPETFLIPPIGAMVRRYLHGVSVDPFARNNRLDTHTNDLDPATCAQHHMDAEAFCLFLAERNVACNVGLFDPPYSPRQISEVYARCGLACGMKETQNGALYRRVRDSLDRLILPGGVVLSFG